MQYNNYYPQTINLYTSVQTSQKYNNAIILKRREKYTRRQLACLSRGETNSDKPGTKNTYFV